ncbi:MAG: SDR family oxidoreductase [Pseudomonadota bacterium]|mgnify:CR=1 FL=1|nr:short-chain dehydrogenase [Gammaproteobacteria bacterium]MEC8010286.1 SDR family oxidoreductase [Pseudomonadota bacterium]HBF07272.1 short-chain dehydrogenase [Gammaproteobacteria bacterium]|tara:strand:+ start:1347 stop:2201 length:855 start_codon:yes stop_codon:yes gene_type:complete
MLEQDFSQRTVLITGCSSGIGLATAKQLRYRGYKVVTTARKIDDIQRINQMGIPCRFMDYAVPQSITETVNWALEHGNGKIYGLFNNGAYGQPGAVEDLTRDVLTEQFQSNFFGWHQMTREVLVHMRKAGEGRIIHNSSVLGIVTLKFRGAYNSSKFALEGLTDTMRLELMGSNIFISLVEPGPIESEFRRHAYAKFKQNIRPDNSAHKQTYERVEARLSANDAASQGTGFTLPPEAVAKKVIHALEAEKPKNRYRVTFPTHLFAFLKRLLPSAVLDKLLSKVE